MNRFFMTPDEYEKLLEKEKENIVVEDNMSDYFKPATDFEVAEEKRKEEVKIESKDLSKESVEKFLSTIVTGKQLPFKSEAGLVVSGGDIFVKLEDLIDMVNSGNYNIISASYINNETIQINYQEISRDYNDGFKMNF